jgi:hypothetical protein
MKPTIPTPTSPDPGRVARSPQHRYYRIHYRHKDVIAYRKTSQSLTDLKNDPAIRYAFVITETDFNTVYSNPKIPKTIFE